MTRNMGWSQFITSYVKARRHGTIFEIRFLIRRGGVILEVWKEVYDEH